MAVDGISRISVPSFTSIPEQTSKVGEQGSGSSFFHILKEVASQDTYLFRTDNGNIGGLVNTVNSSPEDISKILNQQNYIKIEQNPDLPNHLKNGISLIA